MNMSNDKNLQDQNVIVLCIQSIKNNRENNKKYF